jgi:hypothetical protein
MHQMSKTDPFRLKMRFIPEEQRPPSLMEGPEQRRRFACLGVTTYDL